MDRNPAVMTCGLESPALIACSGGHSHSHSTRRYWTEPDRTDQKRPPNLTCQTLLDRREQKMGSHLLNSGGSEGARGSLGRDTDAAAALVTAPWPLADCAKRFSGPLDRL